MFVAGSTRVRTCIWPASSRACRCCEQKGVVAGLHADNVARASLGQVVEMGGVCAEGVFDDDDRQMGMLLAKLFEPAAGGIPLAVVLGLAVLLDDQLWCQWDNFLEVGMDESGPQQLMGIGDAAVAMVLLQARGAMDLRGGEIRRAVERQQVMAVQIDEAFEHLAALQATEEVAETGSAGPRDRQDREWPASGSRRGRG